MACFRLGPRTDEQIRRPAIVAQGLEYGIRRQRQGAHGTRADAVVIGLLTVEADAAVVERANGKAVTFAALVHAVRADADALAAGHTFGVAMDAELADRVAIPWRRKMHFAPDLGVVRTHDGVFRGRRNG